MKLKRFVAAGAVALTLFAAPTAAFAYAPTPTIGVTDATPAVGQSVTVTITNAAPGEAVTLTVSVPGIPDSAIQIAGTQSLTKNADANGVATFTVTISAAGTATITAVGAQSGDLGTTSVTVATGAGSGPVAEGAAPGSTLPQTGANAAGLGILAGGLLVAGAGSVVLVRRSKARA